MINFYYKDFQKNLSIEFIEFIRGEKKFNGLWDKKIKKNKSKILSTIKKNVPLQRFGNIDELMNLINYIVFSKSEFHLGSNFILDGGQSL